jgi:predicted RNA-binding protein with PUA-like domain
MAKRSYWLVKSEPDCFSIQHLARCKNQTTFWSGVRNYQARNFMRDQMQVGDEVLFYHSGANPPAVAGTAVIVRRGYPDHTAWDPKDDHFDPKASPDNPIWQMVDIKLQEIFPRAVPLEELRKVPILKNMELLKQGSRLSVQPVSETEFEAIVSLAHQRAAGTTAPKAATKKRAATKGGVRKAATKKPAAKRAAATGRK